MLNIIMLPISFIICWHVFLVKSAPPLKIMKQWDKLEFVFPSEHVKQEALDKGYYIPDAIHNTPLDVDVHYYNNSRRIFITNPRFGPGRPFTLAILDKRGRLHPYPSYPWHDNQGENCDGLTSVFRTAIDKCNRLWVLDAGRVGDKFSCRPQILAFDLTTDKLVYRHRFNYSSYTDRSLYVTPVVDVRGDDCSDTYVYAADPGSYALGVVSVADNQSWRITNKYFYPDPFAGGFVIDGVHFDVMDGLFGLALSPLHDNDRKLFFHPLASIREGVIKTSYIRNNKFIHDSTADNDEVEILPGIRSNQSAAQAIDSHGILYYGLMNPASIWCYNTNLPFDEKNFHPIMFNEETLQFASGVKVLRNHKGEEELWVVTCRFQKIADGSISAGEVNYRVFAGQLTDILKDSPCLHAHPEE